MKLSIPAALSAVGLAAAQQSVWGQCGGNGWTGPTGCTSGNHCEHYNEWYWQCIPGAATTAQPSTTMRTSTTVVESSQSPSTITTAASNPPSGTDFPSASGAKFTIDGKTKYFAGTNCYWCSFLTVSSDVDSVFGHLQSSGLKILRIWGFNDVNSIPSGQVYFQYLSSSGSSINTGENGLQRLDYVVSAAEARGLKLVINFVNNWDDYGGMKAYTNAFGGDHQGWYTNSAAQAQYRKYIEAVVSRYKNSNAIFAWELANEPRCQGCSTSVIYDWAKSTSAYIKSLDPNHMVTLGDEGFGLPGDGSYPYTYYEGVDWQKNLEIGTLDFATFHLYPDSWGTSYDWGNDWIKSHAALCAAANKPCFFEEYGSESDHCAVEGGWQDTTLSAAGMGGDAFWQFGDTISWGQSHNDGFTIYYGSSEWQCLVTDHVADIS